MHCPFCSTADTKVIDSRLAAQGLQVRRRRECCQCHERFTSFEVAELAMPQIIKSDGRRCPFNEEKLRAGILRSLEKRPVSVEVVDDVMGQIKMRLRHLGEREVRSALLGEMVMKHLRSIDKVAYVRFASVYRSFEDVDDFRDEIKNLENEKIEEVV